MQLIWGPISFQSSVAADESVEHSGSDEREM
jgi:hypothetical protein